MSRTLFSCPKMDIHLICLRCLACDKNHMQLTTKTVASCEMHAPKTSGRLLASPTRLRPISSSLALVVSLILDIMAWRCSWNLGSIRLMRMCSAIWSTGMSSPVMGDTTTLLLSCALALHTTAFNCLVCLSAVRSLPVCLFCPHEL